MIASLLLALPSSPFLPLAQELERAPHRTGREPIPIQTPEKPLSAPDDPEESCTLFPEDPHGWEGRLMLSEGRMEEAEACFWRALEQYDWQQAEHALGVVECMRRTASLHDPRVRPRLFAQIEDLRRMPGVGFSYTFQLGWWYMLLALEGSSSSYELLQREALVDEWRGKAARVVLDLLPEGRGPHRFSFRTYGALEDALERAGFTPQRCGILF